MAIFGRPVKVRLDYDDVSPFPGAKEHPAAGGAQIGLTAAIVILPFFALGVAIFLSWGQRVAVTDGRMPAERHVPDLPADPAMARVARVPAGD